MNKRIDIQTIQEVMDIINLRTGAKLLLVKSDNRYKIKNRSKVVSSSLSLSECMIWLNAFSHGFLNVGR